MATPRVLVVDDDVVARQYLVEVLRALGAQVDVADCGARGQALASADRYDLLVVDRRLPDDEAAPWLHALRAQSAAASRDTPAIVHSAELRAADRTRLLAAGYAAAHQKPVPRDVLAAHLGVPSPSGRGIATLSGDRVREDAHAPVLDDGAGLEACGGREILDGLRQLLHAELARHRRDLVAAAARDDRPAIAALAHRLRGAARYCGTPALVAALDRIDPGTGDASALSLEPALAAIDALATALAAKPSP